MMLFPWPWIPDTQPARMVATTWVFGMPRQAQSNIEHQNLRILRVHAVGFRWLDHSHGHLPHNCKTRDFWQKETQAVCDDWLARSRWYAVLLHLEELHRSWAGMGIVTLSFERYHWQFIWGWVKAPQPPVKFSLPFERHTFCPKGTGAAPDHVYIYIFFFSPYFQYFSFFFAPPCFMSTRR